MKTAIAAILLATTIISPASAGGIKIDRPCNSPGGERCIVLKQAQTYPSDLRTYGYKEGGRSGGPRPTLVIETSMIISSR